MSTKATVILSVVALAALVATYFQWNRAFRAESELAALTVDRDGLQAQLSAEQQRAERAGRERAALQSEIDALKAKQAALAAVQNAARPAPPLSSSSPAMLASQQRTVLNNLRQAKAAIDQFYLENHRAPNSLEEIVGEKKYIRQLRSVNGENYANISLIPGQPLVVTMADGRSVIYDPNGPNTTVPEVTVTPAMQRAAEMQKKLEPSVKLAMEAYRAANNGATPKGFENLGALIPYFASPQEGADFVEMLEAIKAVQLEQGSGR